MTSSTAQPRWHDWAARGVSAMLLAWSASAEARADRRPALHWVRAPGAEHCIDPRSLAQRVEAITGAVFVGASTADVSIEGQIAAVGADQYSVRVKLTTTPGSLADERVLTFSATNCRTLDGPIAFVIAMAIDPDVGSGNVLAELDWMATDPALAAEQLRSELAHQPEPPDRDVLAETQTKSSRGAHDSPAATTDGSRSAVARTPWQVSAAIGGGYGPTSSPSAGLTLFLSRNLSPEFALAGQLQSVIATADVEVGPQRSVATRSVGVALLACATLFDPRVLRFTACGGPESDFLIASGNGFAEDATTLLPSFAAAARLELQHRFDERWGLAAAVLGQLNLTPRTVYFRREGEKVPLFEADRLAILFTLGINHAF